MAYFDNVPVLININSSTLKEDVMLQATSLIPPFKHLGTWAITDIDKLYSWDCIQVTVYSA